MKRKPIIVSEIKINGEWINQDDIPEEVVRKIVEQTIIRAASNIGLVAVPKKKTA